MQSILTCLFGGPTAGPAAAASAVPRHRQQAAAAPRPATSHSRQPTLLAAHRPLVHVVTHPQLSATQIVPLTVDSLHPDRLTPSVFTEFLAQSLISRAAKRQGTVALVLSAVYLPSQLELMQDLAGKQAVGLTVFLSSSAMHAVFHKPAPAADGDQLSIDDISSALEAALGPLQPLGAPRLQVARMAEGSLRQQLRLWDAATWSSVLQQRLESKSRDGPWLAVRSLMGPPFLQAARQLVAKKGLHWVEVPEEQMQALTAGSPASSDSTTGTTGNRRRKRASSAVEQGTGVAGVGPDEEQRGGGSGVVVVISTVELTADEAAQLPIEAFTDYHAVVSSLCSPARASGGDDDVPPCGGAYQTFSASRRPPGLC